MWPDFKLHYLIKQLRIASTKVEGWHGKHGIIPRPPGSCNKLARYTYLYRYTVVVDFQYMYILEIAIATANNPVFFVLCQYIHVDINIMPTATVMCHACRNICQ